MTYGSIFLGLALFVLVGLYVLRPILAPDVARGRNSTEYDHLLALKDAYLAQIHTLDFDYETGKIPEGDYQRQRARLMTETKDILMHMDEIEGLALSVEELPTEIDLVAVPAADTDGEIEAAVARLRQSHRAPTPIIAEKIEASGAEQGASNGEKKFCSQCGHGIDSEDKFCVSCGHQIKVPQHT